MKLYKTLLVLFVTAGALISCNTKENLNSNTGVAVTAVRLNRTSAGLEVGHTLSLKASISPTNATDTTLLWKSSNENIASVDNGVVLGIAEGEVDITVSVGGKQDACHVTVTDSRIFAESVTISTESLTIKKGKTAYLNAEITPSNSTDTLVWVSGDESILTVDNAGLVTGVEGGYSYVIVSAGEYSDTCQVHVQGDLYAIQIDALVKAAHGNTFTEDIQTLDVARGETATLQLLVMTSTGVSNIKPEVLSFSLDGSETMAVTPKIYWQREVKATANWSWWESWLNGLEIPAGGAPSDEVVGKDDMYPDPLMPIDEWDVSLDADDFAGLWIEFPIDRNLAPGTYTGTVKLSGTSSSGALTAEYPFSVKVWPVTLPEDQNLQVVFWTGENFEMMNNGVAWTDAQYTDYMKIVIEFMNDYGQNVWKMDHGSYKQTNMSVATDENGEKYIKFDFDAYYKRDIENFIKYTKNIKGIHGQEITAGVNKEACMSNVYPFYINDDGEITWQYCLDSAKVAHDFFVSYFRQLGDWLKSHKMDDGRTWLDLWAQNLWDEPEDEWCEAYNRVAGWVKEGCPEMKIQEPICTELIDPDLLDMPCYPLNYIGPNLKRADNQQVWMYTAVGPQGDFANRFVRQTLFKTRVMHWCNYTLNTVGYLHYALCRWKVNDEYTCWEWLNPQRGSYPAGDCLITYPGYHKLYPSIRLCAERDGINDFELLKMVEKKDAAKAMEFSKMVASDHKTYNTDLKDFRETRKAILEYLSE